MCTEVRILNILWSRLQPIQRRDHVRLCQAVQWHFLGSVFAVTSNTHSSCWPLRRIRTEIFLLEEKLSKVHKVHWIVFSVQSWFCCWQNQDLKVSKWYIYISNKRKVVGKWWLEMISPFIEGRTERAVSPREKTDCQRSQASEPWVASFPGLYYLFSFYPTLSQRSLLFSLWRHTGFLMDCVTSTVAEETACLNALPFK